MRHLAVLAILLLAGMALSCGGGVFFLSTSGHGTAFFSTSGTVSIVQLTIVDGHQVTVVTLLNNNASQAFHFCGNVANQFPVDSFVSVDFTEGSGCSTVTQVVIN
jgi:hypothetical protein